MKKTLLFLLIILLPEAVFSFDLRVPESTVQGGTVTVVLLDGSEGTRISLVKDGVTEAETESFIYDAEGENVCIALLGVPSNVSAGAYSVSANNGSVEKSLTVNRGSFISEDIELSRSMSDLRQSDDELKAVQWRNLLVLLKKVNISDVYEVGKLDKPVSELRTTSFFGDRRRFLYDDGSEARSVHNGIDYSAEPGTPIYAAGRGRVVFTGERILTGNTAVIEHLPGVYSLYYHMNSIAAAEGDFIEAGDPVGTVGATGLVTGAHLHWEIRVAGAAVNPEPLMSGGLIDKAFILSNIE